MVSRDISKSILLEEVRSYRPSNLRSVDTQVTRCDGRREVESRASSGAFSTRSTDSGRHRQWFAADYRPDLQVAVILPGLLLGAQDVAQDLGRLHKLGVTHILNVATGVSNCFPGDFTYKRLNVRDHPDMEIRRCFEECHRFIDQGRREGWVYVHCNAGISRAPTICISYLMSRQGLGFEAALGKVKEARPIVYPNVGFMRQLREYDKELFSGD